MTPEELHRLAGNTVSVVITYLMSVPIDAMERYIEYEQTNYQTAKKLGYEKATYGPTAVLGLKCAEQVLVLRRYLEREARNFIRPLPGPNDK